MIRAALRIALALSALAATGPHAADLWVKPNDPAVVSTKDCGSVTATHGATRIHRAFQSDEEAGIDVNTADRVNSGDELITDSGGRIEMVSGGNIILVIGENSRVRILALHSFPDPAGTPVTRLDMELLSGEARAQVRLNDEAPAHLRAALAGAEVLVSRGDVALSAGSGWRASVIAGEAACRMRRGHVAGAPFTLPPRRTAGADGEAVLADAAANALRSRLPFSFELTAIALPPTPSISPEFEAP
jgi:hypothetical protein